MGNARGKYWRKGAQDLLQFSKYGCFIFIYKSLPLNSFRFDSFYFAIIADL